MKLGLLGFPIDHSLSPSLYQGLLGLRLTSYRKFSFASPELVPTLDEFARDLDGLNITSPYKTHFIPKVKILDPLVKSLGIVNTIGFSSTGPFATNTDLLAVTQILSRYVADYSGPHLVLLGDGAMAKVTKMVASNLKLKVDQFSRRSGHDLSRLDFTPFADSSAQVLIINACSRDFVFKGKVSGKELFWDYNYNFPPHQESLPAQVKGYQDGREMLELQAREAIKFWEQVNPKLK